MLASACDYESRGAETYVLGKLEMHFTIDVDRIKENYGKFQPDGHFFVVGDSLARIGKIATRVETSSRLGAFPANNAFSNSSCGAVQ